MKKEIKFSLVYRDMWQSSGKYQPRVDQLVRIAPLIIEMGCFARVETNGGAFEQVNLLYGENPNKAVRAFTKPFNDAGIQTHMLDRGLNALRMYPVPADVRRLMYKVKHAQRCGHHPYFLRTERNAQHHPLYPLCARSRHDTAGNALHHPFARAYGRVLCTLPTSSLRREHPKSV